jgi:hypothetical protein
MIGGKIAKNVRPSAESPTGLLRTNAAVASGAQGPKATNAIEVASSRLRADGAEIETADRNSPHGNQISTN